MHSVAVQMYPDGRLDRANAAMYTGFSIKTLAMHATTGTWPESFKKSAAGYSIDETISMRG